MTFTYCLILFIAIVSGAIYITNVINTWISIAAIKDNFVDRQWLTRFLYLIAFSMSVVYLIANS